MKKILFLLLVLPVLAFSQVSNWRTNPPTQSQTSQPQTSQSQQTRVQPPPPQNNASSWRNNPLPPQNNNDSRVRIQNWNRSNQFGYYWGNYGWYQPYPYIWYDDYGLRQRSVVYIYESGRRDTIRKLPVYFTAGIGYTNNNQTSFSGAIGGKKAYFIVDYTMTTAIDQNQYFPYGNLSTADFPISKENFKKESTFYLGAGKKFNKLGIHGMIGFGREIVRYQGKDVIGGISFPKSNSTFTTFKIGLIRDFKFITLKLDTDPIRGYSQIGIGFNNK